MPREWTDEQRAEASRRAVERGFGKPASVTVQEVPPVRRHRSSEVIVAEQQTVSTVEKAKGEDGSPVTTTHTRPGTKIMYKPTERHGYVPKTVAGSAVGMLLSQGWFEFCPDCNGEHLKDGKPSTDPNLCSARDPVAVRICPVCQKRIYDNQRFGEEAEDTDDLNVIKDDSYVKSTGETRTRASMDLHLWVRHPRQAQMMNIAPLPVALRDMVEERK